MNGLRLSLLIFGVCVLQIAEAETEIHKCTDADGGIVYSQLPCPPEPVAEEDESEDSISEEANSTFAEYQVVVQEDAEREPRSAEDVAACKKEYRDAIDAIDAEIAADYSAEMSDDYKQRLLELTRQLREC